MLVLLQRYIAAEAQWLGQQEQQLSTPVLVWYFKSVYDYSALFVYILLEWFSIFYSSFRNLGGCIPIRLMLEGRYYPLCLKVLDDDWALPIPLVDDEAVCIYHAHDVAIKSC